MVEFERSFHELQNCCSWVESPDTEGSSSEVCTWLRIVPWVEALFVLLFCARYWMSRNWSRTRLIWETSTPVPSWIPSLGPIDSPVSDIDGLWVRSTCWRE